jgi:methyl-accepting chemotaxis protein
VESVKRVTDIMDEITTASREQTSGIEQINGAISQMDQVTQQNAALVEQAAAAAESLQDQATNLAQVVSVFKLDNINAIVMEKHKRLAPQVPVAKIAARKLSPSPDVQEQDLPVAPKRWAVSSSAAAGTEWESFYAPGQFF